MQMRMENKVLMIVVYMACSQRRTVPSLLALFFSWRRATTCSYCSLYSLLQRELDLPDPVNTIIESLGGLASIPTLKCVVREQWWLQGHSLNLRRSNTLNMAFYIPKVDYTLNINSHSQASSPTQAIVQTKHPPNYFYFYLYTRMGARYSIQPVQFIFHSPWALQPA